VALRFDGCCDCAGSKRHDNIWEAASQGNLADVQRLVRQAPVLLNARSRYDRRTPLMKACCGGHLEVARWLLDQGAAVNWRDYDGKTALWLAYYIRRDWVPLVRLLVERGADPAIATATGMTPLIDASSNDDLEAVRFLLDHPNVRATINVRNDDGQTALWRACCLAHPGVLRMLLESGADPTIASSNGSSPMAVVKQNPIDQDDHHGARRRECVAALEVSFCLPLSVPKHPVSRSVG
jgi:uncharacterized protein